MPQTIVTCKDLVKTYGEGEAMQTAADHVSFTIDRGEFVVILGPSGAGKSTILNMLGGMDTPTEGTIIVDGTEVSAMNEKQLGVYRAEKIGFVFQFYNLLPSLTALENVALTGNIVKGALDPMEMLSRVGLADHAFQDHCVCVSVCGCVSRAGVFHPYAQDHGVLPEGDRGIFRNKEAVFHPLDHTAAHNQ